MRRLLLLRHAKAVPLSRDDDFGRELTASGRADARRMGAWIEAKGLAPDRAIYSGAARTRETFGLVAEALAQWPEAQEVNALYEATRCLVMGLLRELPGGARAHLVVGHNPGMGDVANLLTGEGPASDRLRLQSKFPTCALAVIAFDRPAWSDLAAGAGRLEAFITPADL